ncbi:MAG TPA: ferric reductase-like transmembrane domain-containing protein [Gaiellaceae bacterium]|nr:ferric reductase-like transmembrane domain-containing protein [Gaiellaceae bacterium]
MNAEWYLMRGSGTVSLLLLTVVVALGIATSRRFRPSGLPLYVTTTVHRNASLLAVAFLFIHVVTAVLDGDARVPLAALVVPFASHWAPFWVGLGALALDLLAAVVVTSLLRKRLKHRTWRAIHWAAYAAWPLAYIHGLGAGTDAATAWMLGVDVACLTAVGAALAWRLAAQPRPAAKGTV